MKVANKLVRWEHEPWTVVVIDGGDAGKFFQALNTQTGQKKPPRSSYERAWEDIPQSPNAEPWGV